VLGFFLSVSCTYRLFSIMSHSRKPASQQQQMPTTSTATIEKTFHISWVEVLYTIHNVDRVEVSEHGSSTHTQRQLKEEQRRWICIVDSKERSANAPLAVRYMRLQVKSNN